MNTLTAWDLLKELHTICHFMSRERSGKASNSELKRWLQNQSVLLNGERVKWDAVVSFPVTSLILFPKRNKTTIW